MEDLPVDQVSPQDAPFTYTGVDVLWMFFLFGKKRSRTSYREEVWLPVLAV